MLGTGFGQAHAAVYAERPDVSQVVVFGRTPQKLAKISGQFGFATTADLDAAITDASVDLVDICLPTPLHADFDLVTSILGRPGTVQVAGTGGTGGRGSAAEVILGYPHAIARCSSSSLMPLPYEIRGGWRATFTGAVLEYAMRAGFTGQGTSTLTEYTSTGDHPVDLPATSPYEAMIDHVLACLAGRADNLIEPASTLVALELTLKVHQRLSSL